MNKEELKRLSRYELMDLCYQLIYEICEKTAEAVDEEKKYVRPERELKLFLSDLSIYVSDLHLALVKPSYRI